MKFSRTTDPTDTPISVDEAKANSQIEHSADDAMVARKIGEAVDYAENYTGRQLMPQTWTRYYDAWPACIELPFRPAQSAVIKYTDEAGDEQTLAADQYQLDEQSYPALIRPAPGASWPALADDFNAVRAEVICGYLSADEVPAGIKSALYLLTGHLYENREASTPIKMDALPMGVESFLNQHRINVL